MNAAQTIRLVCEKSAAPNWTNTKGIYADLSTWPKTVEYYVKCPVCGQLHGSYKTMKEAHAKRLCQVCDHNRIKKLKKKIKKVDEALEGEVDPDLPVDPRKELKRYLDKDWIAVSKLQLERELDELLSIDEDRSDDTTDPDSAVKVRFKVDRSANVAYVVWRTEEDAEKEALEHVTTELEQEPSMFNAEWLENFVDEEKLAKAIGDPYEDFGEELNDLSYSELLDRMVEEGSVYYDSPEFFDGDSNPLPRTDERSKRLDEIKDQWIEENKPELSAKEWMEDVYGKEAFLKLDVLDIEAAAKSAIREDGWAHFLSHYDGRSIHLPNGSVAVREE
jgi:hypothetical protein